MVAPAIAAVSPALIFQGCIGGPPGLSEFDRSRVAVGRSPKPGAVVAAQAELAEESRRDRPGRVERGPSGGLGPHRLFAVVAGHGLDVDAAGPAVDVGILDLRIWVEHESLVIHRETELSGHAVPLGIGGPLPVLSPRGFAPARDGAF